MNGVQFASGARWEKHDDLYATPPPWDIGRPQPAFLALAEAGALRGRVLDVGCGTGEHVLMCAERELTATGIDLAPRALEQADEKARDRGLVARFLLHDALSLPALGESFDTILDCGLFHMLGDEERARFVAGLHTVLRPGGSLFLMCFSDRLTVDSPTRKVSREEIEDAFADGWRTDTIEPVDLHATFAPGVFPAWLATLTRI
ncbi:class I SAM-dependent methyltransferase [Streptomyces sp. NA04227]|uniref:class I SAM-dependent methyltransferase n=1 Tax=Streptomyces sp. NA04227 TaxID=2742136 RepID=UPI001590D855|nr:class I SAM-dependent methyltransferase [Streptomyces sp. NA04227]QKW08266.1 class I SAM-dependent methyltransferase [Streptomyces sp. NA04227]